MYYSLQTIPLKIFIGYKINTKKKNSLHILSGVYILESHQNQFWLFSTLSLKIHYFQCRSKIDSKKSMNIYPFFILLEFIFAFLKPHGLLLLRRPFRRGYTVSTPNLDKQLVSFRIFILISQKIEYWGLYFEKKNVLDRCSCVFQSSLFSYYNYKMCSNVVVNLDSSYNRE